MRALQSDRHAVGYRLVYLPDSSRTPLPDSSASAAAARGEIPAPRLLPVRLWYPAAPSASGSAASISYREYLEVRPDSGARPSAVADSLRERTMDILRYAWRRYARVEGRADVAADTVGQLARLLAAPTRVRRGAPASPGRFPVVVFAGGAYHSVDENVVLWERLASRGYVVAAFPSVGVNGAGLPVNDLGLETMTRDLELVIAYLARVPQADRSRLAAAGFSFGGAAALEAAARNRWVDAVIGLDPSFIARRFADVVRRAPLFAPERVTVPVLELHRADTTVDLGILESLVGAPRYSVELAGLDHVDFNSYALVMQPLLPPGAGPAFARRDSAVAAKVAAYEAMVESIAEFLDAYVGGVGDRAALATALADDAPRWSGVPGGRVGFRYLPGADTMAPSTSGARRPSSR